MSTAAGGIVRGGQKLIPAAKDQIVPNAHHHTPDAPQPEIISGSDQTSRAELIALPASRHRDRRRELIVHQLVAEAAHTERAVRRQPPLPPAA